MSKHTEIPWHVGNHSIGGTTYYDCLLTEDGRAVGQAWIPGEATHDADFIVKAVNCHQELVEALEAILDYNSRAPYGCLTTELHLKTDEVLAKAKNLV